MMDRSWQLSEDAGFRPHLAPDWDAFVLQYDDNLSYLAFNKNSHEAIWLDPVLEQFEEQKKRSQSLPDYRFIAVIDTHTHADHLSNAGDLSRHLGAPLLMHQQAPSQNVDFRITQDTRLSTAAGPLYLWTTPGHTADSMTPVWGPFVFTGDTILYGDTGRDDLPTGNPMLHFESLQKLRSVLKLNQLILPGHDANGRISTWEEQLKINTSLLQSKDDFIRESTAFVGPSPQRLKESLFHNFR